MSACTTGPCISHDISAINLCTQRTNSVKKILLIIVIVGHTIQPPTFFLQFLWSVAICINPLEPIFTGQLCFQWLTLHLFFSNVRLFTSSSLKVGSSPDYWGLFFFPERSSRALALHHQATGVASSPDYWAQLFPGLLVPLFSRLALHKTAGASLLQLAHYEVGSWSCICEHYMHTSSIACAPEWCDGNCPVSQSETRICVRVYHYSDRQIWGAYTLITDV